MKFSFVILHYITYEDTLECVASIVNNISNAEFNIVIVDNGSSNGSGKLLKEKFQSENNIHIIISEKNLGFAKGNNLGYRFAKTELGTDFIVMINNDTIVEQVDFLTLIEKRYIEKNFGIMGPDIIAISNSVHQNPYGMELLTYTEKELKNKIIDLNISIFLSQFDLDIIFKKVKIKILSLIKKNDVGNNEYEHIPFTNEIENVKLHGSCLIFSPDYIRKFNGIYDKTFLYMEEDILSYIAHMENITTLYYPKVKILHKEDVATNTLFNNKKNKRLFKYKHNKKSAIELLKIIKDKTVYLENIK